MRLRTHQPVLLSTFIENDHYLTEGFPPASEQACLLPSSA